MESVAIAERLRVRFPDEFLKLCTFHGQAAVVIRPGRIREILQWLRDDPELRLNHLRSLCGVDNSRRKQPGLSRFEVVYNLYSIPLRHEIRLRAELTEPDPQIDSVVELWPGADWLERETWDLLGIVFAGHPNPRRVLLPEDWEGHPLRKDYPLKGKGEWAGLSQLIERSKELDKHGFRPEASIEAAGEPEQEERA